MIASGSSASRMRQGYGSTAISARRNQRSPDGRGYFRSIWARVRSMSGPYCTPDGHAVTHARQPRQLSKWFTNDGVRSARPSTPAFIR